MPVPMLPQPVRKTLERLEDAGHPSALVGRCVREMLSRLPCADFELLCAAAPAEILRLFPRAVVTASDARRLSLPTAAGPVDLVPLSGKPLAEALAKRDFTVHAIAYRPGAQPSDAWIDPHGGRIDLAARRLRTPGSAKERLGEDPVRALRAARLVGELGFDLDPELASALPGTKNALEDIGGRRPREEIEALLLAPAADRGLAVLRESGLEGAIAPGIGVDAGSVVARLPRDLALRWAGWLRGTRPRAVLRRLRCPRDRALRVERILQLHPVDAGPAAAREARARRLARKPQREVQQLIALRQAELEVSRDARAHAALDHLRQSLDRALRARQITEQREKLAIGGEEVMEQLGCGPGAQVGRALRFLTKRVAEDPTRNEPAALRALLESWNESTSS